MTINTALPAANNGLQNKVIYISAFVFGILGALVVVLFMHLFTPPTLSIGTVNITGLIDRFIKQEAQKNLPPDVLQQEVKTFGIKLEKELKLLSKQKHVVLLPTEAVIAGSHDYTALIKQRLKTTQQGQDA